MKKFLPIIGILCFWAGSILAQTVQVSGTVTGAEDGQPLPGVSVVVRGTGQGTVTDVNGRYSISTSANASLQFSFVGMTTQDVVIGGRQVIDVVMEPSSQTIDEVIVIGYGSNTQRSLASSVTTIKAEGLKDVPSPSFDQMLQGRAAGVSITNPSAGVGQPPVVIIRGVSTINSGTQPLYVIDGVPMISGDIASMGNANALADINPADIESMTILKDAAASAIYGSRAANGVILIATKKGKQGAVKINYDMNIGFSDRTKFWEVMNAQEYVKFKTDAIDRVNVERAKAGLALLTDKYGLWDLNHEPYSGSGEYIDSKWADAIFKKGIIQNHSLSISNATEKADYYISVNRTKQEGIVIGDEYERSGIRANGSVQPMKYLKIGMNANYSYGHTQFTDAARNGSLIATAGFPRVALMLPPNIPIRKLDGTPYFEYNNAIGYGPNNWNCTYFNPIANHELGNKIDTWVNRMIASVYAELTIITGLKYKTQYGMDFAQSEDKRNWNPFHGDGGANRGLANAYHAKESQWTWTNTLSYTTTIATDHSISALIGMESYQNNYGVWGFQGLGSTDFAFSGIEANYTSYTSGTTDFQERTMLSYLGNLHYSYLNKYILSGNFRRDGLSALGVNSRWGNFWGVAAAWRISEEDFFGALLGTVNDLKLKASYGVVGNTEVGWYPAKSWYSSGYYGGAGTVVMSRLGDANLKWESSSTLNAGIEATLLNRINIQLEGYIKKSNDLILGVQQAPSTGLGSLTTNKGKIGNKGVEITISADVLKGRDFTWNTSFNYAFNRNEVLKLEEDLTHGDANYTYTVSTEGKSLAQLFMYPTGGIDPESGRRVFYGTQGEKVFYDHYEGRARWLLEDGTVSAATLSPVMCGNTLPTYSGGWTNTFLYKGFDLNLFFQFSGGNYIYNGMRATGSDMRFWNNTKDVLNNHWTETNRNAKFAKPYYGDNVSNGSANFMSDDVEKGDYLRFKNISLGYTFNTRNWGRSIDLNISSLRVYVQAQNLLTITGYTGLDPETITKADSPILMGGIDKNTLPQARSITFGLNVSF